MAYILRIFALVIKEFLALLKDKKSRTTIIVPPLVQLIVFGYAATFDLNNVKFAILNEDRGAAARDLIQRFEGSKSFEHIATLHSNEEINQIIDNRRALLVLHIEQLCTEHLLRKEPCTVQVILDGRNSNTAMLALNYVREIVAKFNLDWMSAHTGQKSPAGLTMRAWFNPNLESRWFFIPGIVALLSLVVTLVVTSLSVAREREAGTFDQLLVTPYTPLGILLGKAIPGLIIGLGEGMLIVFLAINWFKVPFQGSFLVLITGLMIYILAVIGVGLMISSMCATQQQGLMGAFLFLVPAVILSGFATPIANMPKAVQLITYLDPMRYFLIIVRRSFLEGVGVTYLWDQMWPMLIMAVVTLTSAAWFFRHKLY